MTESLGQPIHKDLYGITEYPYTLSYCIRKAQQINSFFDLPKKQQPPEKYWFDEEYLQEWFDNVSANEPNTVEIYESDIE